MRWKEPKSGEIKIKKKFAILPIEIEKETRWLEWVTIKYRFSDWDTFRDPRDDSIYKRYGWIAEEFIDDETEAYIEV